MLSNIVNCFIIYINIYICSIHSLKLSIESIFSLYSCTFLNKLFHVMTSSQALFFLELNGKVVQSYRVNILTFLHLFREHLQGS